MANPNKTKAVSDILVNNKEKLLKYLEDFHNDRGGCQWKWRCLCPEHCQCIFPLSHRARAFTHTADDEQFKEEKAVITKEISMMGA